MLGLMLLTFHKNSIVYKKRKKIAATALALRVAMRKGSGVSPDAPSEQ
jgi:hypothetical protein